jgi:hypothetical protein
MADVKSNASSKVTVACKLPHGLLLRNFRMVEVHETVPGGFATVKRAEQIGATIKINGTAFPFGQIPRYQIVGGYALTPNVDADMFAKWLTDNADSDIVKNNLIGAFQNNALARDWAKEHRALKNGLEPLNVLNGAQDDRLRSSRFKMVQADEMSKAPAQQYDPDNINT